MDGQVYQVHGEELTLLEAHISISVLWVSRLRYWHVQQSLFLRMFCINLLLTPSLYVQIELPKHNLCDVNCAADCGVQRNVIEPYCKLHCQTSVSSALGFRESCILVVFVPDPERVSTRTVENSMCNKP